MLHEQPGHELAREKKQASLSKQPGSTRYANWIAFGSGLLFSFLTANSAMSYLGPKFGDSSFPFWTAWLPLPLPYPFFLLLPLILGIILPFTGGIMRKNLISFAYVRGLQVWAGISLYWLPLAIYGEIGPWGQEIHDICEPINYHGFCGIHLGPDGLFLYLILSYLLLLLFTMITAGVIIFYRKNISNRI